MSPLNSVPFFEKASEFEIDETNYLSDEFLIIKVKQNSMLDL